jgi:hypothetical protein
LLRRAYRRAGLRKIGWHIDVFHHRLQRQPAPRPLALPELHRSTQLLARRWVVSAASLLGVPQLLPVDEEKE